MPGRLRSESKESCARKALCIGIQYDNTSQYGRGDPPDRLHASHGDPDIISKLLIDLYDYNQEDITFLKDDGKHTAPTRHNILKAIDDLVAGAKAGDHFVFHYSGHGSQVPNDDGEDYEEDGMDETIWPVDVVYDREKDDAVDNYIKDDELKKRLVDRLPAGTHLIVLLDCCHSGTGIDLPNTRPEEEDLDLHEMWSPITNNRGPFAAAIVKDHEVTESHIATISRFPGKFEFELKQEFDNIENELRGRMKRTKLQKDITDKYVTSWGACVDSEIELEGPNGGLLSRAFDKLLRANCSRTHEELIHEIGKELVETTRPAKQQWTERGWGALTCPRPVLASLQKLEEVYPLPFTF